MTTDNFENNKPKETSENFDQSASNGLSDRLNADLYKDMSMFENKSTATLPGLEIAGLGNESAMKALSDSKAKPTPQGETVDSKEAGLKQAGMKPAPGESYGSVHVYKPANGETDKQGRSKVELIHEGGQLQYEMSTYPDGKVVANSYSTTGKLEYTKTTTPDGKSLTTYPNIKENADTMADAYKKEGAEGLKKQIDSILKQGGSWDQIDKMLGELKQRGVSTYEEGGVMKISEWGFDSTFANRSNKAAAPQEAPASQSDHHPAAPGFVPSWWGSKVRDGLTPKK